MAKEQFNVLQTAAEATNKVVKMVENGLTLEKFNTFNVESTSYADYFSWEKVFIAAAAAGNMPIMLAVDARQQFVSDGTLDKALRAIVDRNEDNDETAHWLIMMGASPFYAPADEKPTYLRAFESGQTRIVTEIVTWAKDFELSNCDQRTIRRKDNPFQVAMDVYDAKVKIEKAGSNDVRAAYIQALGNQDFACMAAAYTESQKSYFSLSAIRRSVTLKSDGFYNVGDGILLALSQGHEQFALQMMRDGVDPKDVSKTMVFNTTGKMDEKARALYADMVDGTVDLGTIPSIPDRRLQRVMEMTSYYHPLRG